MRKFIRELRRREVFRSAGLYVGICWILIEGASVVFPVFDVPDAIIRFMIIASVVGFPIMLVLAWVYDVSSKGVVVQAEATDTVVLPFGSRKGDLIVIGVLSVALVFSVYLNVKGGRGVTETIDPFSVLIADFDNETGDSLFDGALEQGLQIGIEGAPFISVYERGQALKVATELQDADKLDSVTAQLVAAREGIKLVLAGSITPRRDKFDLSVQAIVPTRGEIVAEADATAAGKPEVLAAIGELAADLREDLGDRSVDRKALKIDETFTAMSLEAARDYDTAQRLQYDGNYEKAIEHYRAAVEHDPKFGRAMSGWALSLYYLGRQEEAGELWERALSKSANMTPRERFRTQGLYFLAVQGNYAKGIESFRALVDSYPADSAGYNNLAVAYFSTLDFEQAQENGRKALEIYPTNKISLSNYALYAMYAGDFETAEARARELLEIDGDYYMAWLPIAISAAAADDIETAQQSYRSMGENGGRGASLAALGLADLAMFQGKHAEAAALLHAGIAADLESDNKEGIATKTIALAQVLADMGDSEASLQAISDALDVRGGLARKVPAALLYLQFGDLDTASAIADELGANLQPQSRAYANLIHGVIDSRAGRHFDAIEKLQAAIALSDFWLIRFYLGHAYLAAGAHVEALDEFMNCAVRQGEASALFLDDLPTWRYMATLPYWLGRAQDELGMSDAARESYLRFLDNYHAESALVEDAKARTP